jgi:transcriptional regulator with XRE-family HTH domain
MKLSEIVRQYREEHGLSLRSFAERVGISHNAELSRLEPSRAVDTTAIENLLNQPWESLYGDLDADGKSSFWCSMIDHITWDGANISIEFKN